MSVITILYHWTLDKKRKSSRDKELAVHLPRPWERYLKSTVCQKITPSMVQRNYQRIITQIGTPANSPKQRLSWVILLIATILWPIVVPLAYLELLSKRNPS